MTGHAWAWLKPVWYLISLCFQIQVKETLKHKQQGAGKADTAVEVRPELDSRRGGERPKNVLWGTCIFLVKFTRFFSFLYVGKLMKAEERGSGDVSWSVYGAYIKAAGGPLVFLLNMVLFLSTTGSIAFSNWWLSHWIKQGSGVSSKRDPAYCHSVCILEKLFLGMYDCCTQNKSECPWWEKRQKCSKPN